MEDHESYIKDRESYIKDRESYIEDRGSRIKDQGSGFHTKFCPLGLSIQYRSRHANAHCIMCIMPETHTYRPDLRLSHIEGHHLTHFGILVLGPNNYS